MLTVFTDKYTSKHASGSTLTLLMQASHCFDRVKLYFLFEDENLKKLALLSLKRQCQPQCICLHFTLKVMECQQITIINISLVLCRYNSVKMSKYNHRMVEIYDGLKTKT
jgi:hypothetical protein